MSDSKYWSVTVSINGDEVLTIGKDELAGVPNIEDHANEVRECARHLLAFIGEEPNDDGQPDEMTEWRDFDPDC